MRIIGLLCLLFISSLTQASTVKLDYSVFFNYMKTMYKLDYQYVTTAFYLIDSETQEQCHIHQVDMVIEDQREPVLFESPGRLLPFYSDKHRKDGAVLLVDIDDQKSISNCYLQIKIMAKESELSSLDEEKLYVISEQLEGVLKKNAGMFGKYFLPEFLGINVQFSSVLSEEQSKALGANLHVAENGNLLLPLEQFKLINKINDLNLVVTRITPWLAKTQ